MKVAVKIIHRRRRIIKKVALSFFLACVLFFVIGGSVLYFVEIKRFFDYLTVIPIDTAEIDAYYDLLSKHKQSGKDLVFDLKINDTDSLQIVIDKLKVVMGLKDYTIGLDYYNKEKPPAYIERNGNRITVFVSNRIKGRREEMSLLAHELSHIYVWRLDSAIFGKCDQEKLVDCVTVFLGLGVFSLNSCTDEYSFSIDGKECQARKKTFGYLKPEQFGYLLVRYCAEHNINSKDVKPHLTATGQKYFNNGNTYLRQKNNQVRMPAQLVIIKLTIERSARSLYKKLVDVIHVKIGIRARA